MISVRNIVAILVLILVGVLIGLSLGADRESGESVRLASPASTPRTGAGRAETGSDATSTTAAAARPATAATDADWGVVIRVADGDTLTVRFEDGQEETIRFLDVDTPETVHPTRPRECYGAQASDFTKQLLGQRVGIESKGRDKYGRMLGYVWTGAEQGGQLWNTRLLEEGLAVYNDYGNPGKYAHIARAAAELAMQGGVGLWSACERPASTAQPTLVPTPAGLGACLQGCVSQPDPSCSIKGNVNKSQDTKIYHVVGGSSYARVNMKEEEGDLWFCTRQEAEANGFRAPAR